MTNQFDIRFGQSLCDLLSTELGLVCSFMGKQGRIVASSERARIGSCHAIAAQIMRGEMDDYGVSRQEAGECPIMREGLNMGIDFEGTRLISFAIAGPLEVVRPVARLVRFSVASLLRVRQQEVAVDAVSASDQAGFGAATAHEVSTLPFVNLPALLSHASQTLENNLSRLRDAIDSIDQGLTMFDPAQRLVVWNRRFLELLDLAPTAIDFGLTLEAIIRYAAERAAHAPTAIEAMVARRLALFDQRELHRFEHVMPDGMVLEIIDRPLPGGGFVSTYTDITQRRQAEVALRTAYSQAERLVQVRTHDLLKFAEMSSDWFWEQDAQFRFTRFFGQATDKLRRQQSDFLGKRRWDMPIHGISPAQLARHVALHERHEAFHDFEYQIPSSDGSVQYFLVSGTPRFNEQGAFTGYHGIGSNITERRYEQKLLESRTQALQSAHDELEARVAERTAALSQQLHFMQQLIEAIPGPVYYKDTRSHYLGCNSAYEAFMGKSASEIIGKTPRDIAPAELVDTYLAADRALFCQPGVQIYESEVRNAHGELRNVMFHKATFTRPDGSVGGLVGVMLDITERKRMEENLRQAATVFDSSAQGLTIAAADGTIMAVNRAFTEITGYEESEVIGRNPRMLQSGRHDKAFYRAMWDCIATNGRWQGEVWNRRKNGNIFPEWISITAVYDKQDRVTNYVATFSDITQQKQTEEKIQMLAFTDPLTSLPNRRLLLDRLQHALVTSLRSQCHGALFFIDLDDFKALNDTRGHHVGDLLLKQVAQRLTECVREGDTVARLGGDEFVVMLEGLDSNSLEAISQTEVVGAKILAALNQPYLLAAGRYHSTPSIGVTLFGDEQSSLDELLKQADLAMYRAKSSGRNTLRFFDPEMQSVVAARVDLEDDLRLGLLRQQFVLYYQPQVDHASRVTGVEALVRWLHPARGLVLPGEFIPLAEDTKLILPLGLWVLKTACAQLDAWARRPETAHLTMAVNVSTCQFRQGDFVDQVLGVLECCAFDANRLKLELTESLLLDDVQDVIAKMSALKSRGVGFSLDDFGTGYSSLAYLKRLPLDQLKIDQSFVGDVLLDANDAAIARTIVTLAHSLGLSVIAEGVETEAQLLFLVSNNCHAFQGYLFSRPLPLQDVEEYLSSAPHCSGGAGTLPPPGPPAESARPPL